MEKLLGFIGAENIVEELLDMEGGEQLLTDIGSDVKRRFDEDLDSMEDWINCIEKGLDLMKQEFQPKSTPWEGASNFKSPMLSEAGITFGDKASLELLRARNLVKADIVGRDKDGQKKELAGRVSEAMNYQINYQMKGWRDNQKRMMYVLPNSGTMFKKTVFDPVKNRPESYVIQYPDFVVNQATTDIDDCRSFSQVLDVDLNGVLERQYSGLWRDVDLYPAESDGDEGSNEKAGTTDASSNPDRFIEQHCYVDIDGDGYEEPYIVTIHEQTSTVVRIVARYTEESFIVRNRSGRIVPLGEAIRIDTAQMIEMGIDLPERADLSQYKLVRIEPEQQITKYGFIPSPDGTFLDLGYFHLLGAIVQGINTTTNQLTDAGTLRNAGGGFLAKGFRRKMGPIGVKPGRYIPTEISARELQTAIMPNPNPEPSSVLFSLNEKFEAQGRQFAAIVDNSGQITANTAPTTALAMIQESLISVSALLGRVLDGMSREFQILFRINKKTFDNELYQTVLDEDGANARADFNNESLDIIPTASPEMSSRLQRIQTSVVEIEQIPNVVAAGGNPMPIVRNFFERIGSSNLDEIFPDQPTDEQAEEMARFREAQEMANQIQQQQLALSQLQTELMQRDQERRDLETNAKVQETIGKLEKMRTESLLNLEKAESEEVKNQINTYTAEIQSTISILSAMRQSDVSRLPEINGSEERIRSDFTG